MQMQQQHKNQMSKQRPIKIKIDVTKIDKSAIFHGKKGKYLDAVIWPNKDGTGEYGDTHYIVQEISKERREAGERGPIIGNATVPENMQETKPAAKAQATANGMEDDEIPF